MIRCDLLIEKELHDQILLQQTWDRDYRYLAITLDTRPTVVSIGAVIPECDFAGNTLSILGQAGINCDLLGFSLLASEDGGTIVWACLRTPRKGWPF